MLMDCWTAACCSSSSGHIIGDGCCRVLVLFPLLEDTRTVLLAELAVFLLPPLFFAAGEVLEVELVDCVAVIASASRPSSNKESLPDPPAVFELEEVPGVPVTSAAELAFSPSEIITNNLPWYK